MEDRVNRDYIDLAISNGSVRKTVNNDEYNEWQKGIHALSKGIDIQYNTQGDIFPITYYILRRNRELPLTAQQVRKFMEGNNKQSEWLEKSHSAQIMSIKQEKKVIKNENSILKWVVVPGLVGTSLGFAHSAHRLGTLTHGLNRAAIGGGVGASLSTVGILAFTFLGLGLLH